MNLRRSADEPAARLTTRLCQFRKAPLGEAQLAQQLPLPPTVPPPFVQRSADDFVLHFAPQSRSVTQASAGFFAQVPSPVAASTTHVSVGKRQRTNPGLPHVERAAQLTTLPLQFPGTVPSATSDFTTCATQRTKRPWLLASSQDGHCAMIA